MAPPVPNPRRLKGPITRDDGFAIIKSRMSRADIRNLLAAPDGEAMTAAIVDVFVDESQRLERNIDARHLLSRASDQARAAGDQAFATASIVISRDPAKIGAPIVIPTGTLVDTSDGHEFALSSDASPPTTYAARFAAGGLTMMSIAGVTTVRATATSPGFTPTSIAGMIATFADVANEAEGDVASITLESGARYLNRGAGDYFTPQMVGNYLRLTAGANIGRLVQVGKYISPIKVLVVSAETAYDATTLETLSTEAGTCSWMALNWDTDLGFSLSQPTDTTQGYDDTIDALAREKGRQRQTGESAETLRAELMAIVDVVSPGAILRAVNRVLGPLGPAFLYEQGTTKSECDVTLGSKAFPGVVWGKTAWSLVPDRLDARTPGSPAPPPGLAIFGRDVAFFILRWDGSGGVFDTGGYWGTQPAAALPTYDPSLPKGAAWGLSPWTGGSFRDAIVRRAIAAAINRIKGAGIQWKFSPRMWFG